MMPIFHIKLLTKPNTNSFIGTRKVKDWYQCGFFLCLHFFSSYKIIIFIKYGD